MIESSHYREPDRERLCGAERAVRLPPRTPRDVLHSGFKAVASFVISRLGDVFPRVTCPPKITVTWAKEELQFINVGEVDGSVPVVGGPTSYRIQKKTGRNESNLSCVSLISVRSGFSE